MRPEVIVVGSINHDLVVATKRRPEPGETVLGESLTTAFGGKGANQAVAAARAGGRVAMVGCVGRDAAGEAMVAELRAAGVAVSTVRVCGDIVSGMALIVVDGEGENSIVVVPGANDRVKASDVEGALTGLGDAAVAPGADGRVKVSDVVGALAGLGDAAVPPGADAPVQAAEIEPAKGDGLPIVLAQLEIPDAPVIAAARSGARFVLNPSPVRPLHREVLAAADPLVVNAGEAAAITELSESADPAELIAAAHGRGIRSIVITLGGRGAAWSTGAGSALISVAAPQVEVVDTTGAGDVFAGTLAVRIARGDEPAQALSAAVAAGAQAVGWPGARAPGGRDHSPTAAH